MKITNEHIIKEILKGTIQKKNHAWVKSDEFLSLEAPDDWEEPSQELLRQIQNDDMFFK